MSNHIHNIQTASNGVLLCCSSEHGVMGVPSKYDCRWIEEFIDRGLDSKWIKPGSTVILNAFLNDRNSITTVRINEDPLAGEVYEMHSLHTRDVGGTTSLYLGVWMPGEGRRSIRASLHQAMARCLDPRDIGSRDRRTIYTKCPNPGHGLQQDRLMKEKCADVSTTYKSICLFNMIFEKMCTECLQGIAGPANDDFGIPAEAEGWT